MVTTLKMAMSPCAEKMRRVMIALMVSMMAIVMVWMDDVVESAASRRLKNYEKSGKDFRAYSPFKPLMKLLRIGQKHVPTYNV